MARSDPIHEDRTTPTYLRVRPTESSPPTDRINAQVEQLHGTLTDQAVEVRLESVGDEVALYYGTTGRATRSLDRILRTIYPDDYTIERQAPDLAILEADDHVAVTSTGRFPGNADYLNHQRREFEKRRANLQQTATDSEGGR